jgi:hypothetical protein
MVHPRFFQTYALIIDASTGIEKIERGICAILMQIERNGKFRAISYASKQLINLKKELYSFLARN